MTKTIEPLTVETPRAVREPSESELKVRARDGDVEALQALRDRGYFKRRGKVASYAASHAQKRLWILDQMGEGSTAYNVPGSFLLTGALDVEAFRRALSGVVARHESLRTTFVDHGGEPRQIIHGEFEVEVPLADLTPAVDAEALAREIAHADAETPFDLERGPLLRAKLLCLAPRRHVFVLILHHIVCDGWSVGVLMRELATFYRALRRGEEPVLPPLPLQYKDYAVWQNDLLEGGAAERHRDYWLRKLGGDLPLLELPLDRPRPAVQSFAGDIRSITLGAEDFLRLRKFGQGQGASLFMVLVAVVKVLLQRYTGQEDIVLGSPIAGREHPDLEDQIGFYLNTLVLRDTVRGGDSLATVLRGVRQTAAEAYEHQLYPFDLLVDLLIQERDRSRAPLTDVMIALLDFEGAGLVLDGLEVADFDHGFAAAKFDLSLHFTPTSDGLVFGIGYNTDLLCASTIERLAVHWKRLVQSLLDDPAAPISQARMLTPAEERQLADWNDTAAAIPAPATVLGLIARQVRQAPDRIALAAGEERLNYRLLGRRSSAVAAGLRHVHGLRREERVGLLAPAGVDAMVGLLGILKAGGAYLPLDPDHPPKRLAAQVVEGGCRVILTVGDTLAGSALEGAQLIDLKTLAAGEPATAKELERWAPRADDLAYVISTSGSTGRPKGVMIEHGALRNLVAALDAVVYEGLPGPLVVALVAPLIFDASVKQIFAALALGHTLYLVDRDTKLDTGDLVRTLREAAIDVCDVTPGLFAVWLEEWQATGAACPLQCVILGGEPLPADLVRRFYAVEEHRQTRLVNAYGPTECSVDATFHVLDPTRLPEDTVSTGLPIGRPLPNIRVYITGRDLERLPAGIPGEICLAGVGLARGYLGAGELSAERFVANPFEEGERLYRTGDLGRFAKDGNLHILGRHDHQVKIRGYRLELGEIESRALALAGVEGAAAVLRPAGAAGAVHLVLYVVPRGLEHETLREGLAAELPEYMMPSFVVGLDRLPLTAGGKIDRAALPEPTEAPPVAPITPPRDEVETAIAGVFLQVLELVEVDVDANFYDLGGHSLNAIMVVAGIRRELEVKVTLRDMFRAPTVAGLAELVRERRPAPLQSIEPIPRAEHYAVSPGQRRLWVIQNMAANKSAYNIPGTALLRGDLDTAALERALARLVESHEALRTTFLEVDGEPRQRLAPHADFRLGLVDLRSSNFSTEELRERVRADAIEPFDLVEGPVFKAWLYRVGEDSWVFLLALHHIAGDGWSIDLLIAELMEVYRAFVAGEASPLAERSVHYKDFAAWQNKLLASAAGAKHREYWLEKLAGELPLLDLPADHPRPPEHSLEGDIVRLTLAAETAEALRHLGRQQKASTFMVLVALAKVLLYRVSGQRDLLVGTPVAGREHPDLHASVGFFINMLPLRDRLVPSDGFLKVLDKVQTTVTEALEHQIYPFDRLVEDLELRRDLGRSPVFDVAVAMQNPGRAEPSMPGVEVEEFEIENRVAKFDLTFHFADPGEGECAVVLEYSTDLFRRSRIERLAASLSRLAEQVVAAPQTAVACLDLRTAGERTLLAEANDTGLGSPRVETLATRFAAQVAAGGDRPAVACGEQVLSYRQLDALASGLAATLEHDHGVRPGECVGVLLERSAWTVVALVGILQAGGLYVPLDPSYPPQRIEDTLQDAGCRVVVTEGGVVDLLEPRPGRAAVDVRAVPETGRATDQPAAWRGEGGLAYVIYTSGSTGRPKGSLVPRQAILRLVVDTNYVAISPEDRVAQTGSLAFDASTFEIWGALLNGACVCLPVGDEMLEAAELARFIARHGVNILFLTTGLFNQLVETGEPVFEGLRLLLTGGEKVSVRHINAVRERYPSMVLQHVYGPTENTTFSTFHEVEGASTEDVPIGRPITGSTFVVLDAAGAEVPVGVPGELCLGGGGLACGYLHRARQTATSFVPDPKGNGGRLYRTGDLVVFETSGDLRFLGRIDTQIKVRGRRVEPGEVEARLLAHPAVGEALVMARETTVGTRELVAWYAAAEAISAAELRAYLGETLPEFMVPAHLVYLEQFPLTANGKIDRRALPSPEAASTPVEDDYRAPESAAERLLCEVWQAVLGRERIGTEESYFELGGDSIRAIQITSRLRRAGWRLEVRDLFLYATIEELAPRLRLATPPEEEEGPLEGPVPLTAVQRWFFERFTGAVHHFNQAVLLRAVEPLDEAVLRVALAALQAHHDALRLTFHHRDETFEQVQAGPEVPLCFARVDLRGHAAPADALAHHAAQEQASIHLEQGPVMRSVHYRLDDGDRLLLVIHHLVVDAVSWRVLLEDFDRACHQAKEQQAIDLGAKSVSWKHWAERVARHAASAALLDEVDSWAALAGVETALPVDAAIQEDRYGEADVVQAVLPALKTQTLLTDAHRAYNTDARDLLLTALGRALRAWHGRDETLVTLEGHGREALFEGVDVGRTVGWFTSLFPFRLAVSGNGVGTQIKLVKEALRRMPAKGVGFGILRYLGPEEVRRQLARVPVPRVSFNYLGQLDGQGTAAGLFTFAEESCGPEKDVLLPRPHELDIGALVLEGRLHLSISFNPRRHHRATVEGLLANFEGELVRLIEHCAGRENTELTPSDITYEGFDAAGLDNFLDQLSGR